MHYNPLTRLNELIKPTDKRYYLCEWTQGGRNHVRISDNWQDGPAKAVGTYEACVAASRLLYPPEWEEAQRWREAHYDLTGKLLFIPGHPYHT